MHKASFLVPLVAVVVIAGFTRFCARVSQTGPTGAFAEKTHLFVARFGEPTHPVLRSFDGVYVKRFWEHLDPSQAFGADRSTLSRDPDLIVSLYGDEGPFGGTYQVWLKPQGWVVHSTWIEDENRYRLVGPEDTRFLDAAWLKATKH
jgi:hypothetical protein